MTTQTTNWPAWDTSVLDKLVETDRYLKIGIPGASGEDFAKGKVVLTGAKGFWKKHPDAIFLPNQHLVGPADKLREFFAYYKYPPQDIEEEITTAFSLENTQEGGSHCQEFLEATTRREEALKQARDKRDSTAPRILLTDLTFALKKENTVSEDDSRKVQAKAATRGAKEPLKTRLEKALAAEKVVNVSKIRPDGGGTALTTLTPNTSLRTTTVNVISGLYSNNVEGFETAARLLQEQTGVDYSAAVDEFRSLMGKPALKAPEPEVAKPSPLSPRLGAKASVRSPAAPAASSFRR